MTTRRVLCGALLGLLLVLAVQFAFTSNDTNAAALATSHARVAPVEVQSAPSDPVYVKDVSTPADPAYVKIADLRTPVNLDAYYTGGTGNYQVIYTVPEGKIFVLRTVSVYCELSNPFQFVIGIRPAGADPYGDQSSPAWRLHFANSTRVANSIWAEVEEVEVMIPAGQEVVTGTSWDEQWYSVSLAGYLIDG